MSKSKTKKKGGRPPGMRLIIPEKEPVICNMCQKEFLSVDRTRNRRCPKCETEIHGKNYSKFAMQTP
jgi:tRNA(Ile2) C34 agmatinyltransferase TiaS